MSDEPKRVESDDRGNENYLYPFRPGQRLPSGETIEVIHFQNPRLMVFSSDDHGLSIRKHEGLLTDAQNAAVQEMGRLCGVISSKFGGVIPAQLYGVLTQCTVACMGKKDDADVFRIFEPVEALLDSYGDVRVEGAGKGYIVFVSELRGVDWIVKSSLNTTVHPEFDELRAVIENVLDDRSRDIARPLLARAVCVALSSDGQPNQSLHNTRQFVESRCEAKTRTQHLAVSLAACVAIVLGMWLSMLYYGGEHVSAAMAVIGGTVGSLISLFQRSNKLNVDPLSSDTIIVCTAGIRVIIGALAGCMVYAAAKSGLAFGFTEGNAAALFTVGVASGFSERFIPGLIDRIGGDVKDDDSPAS